MESTTKEWISVAETAKFVRKSLAHNFAGIKFGVRSKSYSGGASIRVTWTDGPTSDKVKKVVSNYEGASFDGMIDLKSYHDTILAGPDGVRHVHFGADYIFTDRSYSDAFIQKAIDALYSKYQWNFQRDNLNKPTIQEYRNGNIRMNYKLSGGFDWDFVGRELNATLCNQEVA